MWLGPAAARGAEPLQARPKLQVERATSWDNAHRGELKHGLSLAKRIPKQNQECHFGLAYAGNMGTAEPFTSDESHAPGLLPTHLGLKQCLPF